MRYSDEYGRLALDLCLFLNGLPIITIELKNQFTKQTYNDAIKQYKTDAQNARDESDRAARDAIFRDVTSAMELYEAFMDDKRNSNNQSFSKWLLDLVFTVNYHPEDVTRV